MDRTDQQPPTDVKVKHLQAANRVLIRAIAREKRTRAAHVDASRLLHEAKKHVKLLLESMAPSPFSAEGIDRDKGVLRLSFTHYTTEAEVAQLITALDLVLAS